MMDGTKVIQTVVEGEASESDDEEEATTVENKDCQRGAVESVKQGTVVSGEASESDEEEHEIDTSARPVLLPLTVDPDSHGDKADIISGDTPTTPTSPLQQDKPRSKYNSLLHRKLRERNAALRRHLVDTISQAYDMAARDLHNNTLQLLKTQSTIQDVAHFTRMSTNELFQVEDKLDIITSCNLLHDLNITLPETKTPS